MKCIKKDISNSTEFDISKDQYEKKEYRNNNKIFITSKKKNYILIFDDNKYKTNIDLIDKIILLKDYIKKNPLIDKINLNKLIKTKTIFIEFILNYAKIYPINKEEEEIPEYKNVTRDIKNLLNSNDLKLFNSLLNNLKIKEKILLLIKLNDLCEKLKMDILSDKIANIICTYLKDKPIHEIKDFLN